MPEADGSSTKLKHVKKCGRFECGKFFHDRCRGANKGDEEAFICNSHKCKACGVRRPNNPA
jgi:hypothetical protein